MNPEKNIEATVERYIRHVQRSVQQGLRKQSKVPTEILEMEGMSGIYTRHIYNNLCGLGEKEGRRCRYLEIGTWKGSTFLSAMYGNSLLHGTCVDNWSEFGGPKTECLEHFRTFFTHGEDYQVIDRDCWTLDRSVLGDVPIDLYLYDGPHTFEDHRRAITSMVPYMAPVSIVIVDDWCCDWADVRRGTMAGWEAVKDQVTVRWKLEIPILGSSAFHTRGDTTWNGMGIFVCTRVSP